MTLKQFNVWSRVIEHRKEQEKKWPGQTCAGDVDPLKKLAVVFEEAGEVATEVNDAYDNLGKWTYLEKMECRERLRTELVQLAACAVAWLESME